MTSSAEKEKQKLAVWFFLSALAMLYAGFWGSYLVLKFSSYWGRSELIASFGAWKMSFLLCSAIGFFIHRLFCKFSTHFLFLLSSASLCGYLAILMFEYDDLLFFRSFFPASNLFASFFYAFSILQALVVLGISLWFFHKVFLRHLEKDLSIPQILTVFLTLMETSIFTAFYMR